MTVVGISRLGGPEVLVLEQRAVPAPNRHEILIKVAAAGINRGDIVQRHGNYPPPAGASDILGLEVAGAVVATGKDATRSNPATKVMHSVPAAAHAHFSPGNE